MTPVASLPATPTVPRARHLPLLAVVASDLEGLRLPFGLPTRFGIRENNTLPFVGFLRRFGIT